MAWDPTDERLQAEAALVYYGTAGSTAGTQLTCLQSFTDNTNRAKSTPTPHQAGHTAHRHGKWTVSFTLTCLTSPGDAGYAALETAAANGTPIALYFKDYSSGKGWDADFLVDFQRPLPNAGDQVTTFTCVEDTRTREGSYH